MSIPPEVQALLQAAERDRKTAELLAQHADAPIASIGFHLQQYMEKVMKAVLVFHAVIFRRTHDLQELADLLLQQNVQPPIPTEQLTRLNPFAVTLRYDDLILESQPIFLTAEEATRLIAIASAWVNEQIDLSS